MAPADNSGFEVALKETAAAVDAVLERLLPPRDNDRLRDAMRYGVLAPGKRLRPFLVVQSAALFDVDAAEALRIGAALECVHCYSLIHDDLPAMDNDNVRRGMPATHRKFDEATAILAGDGLLTLAFGIVADAATNRDPAVRSALVSELAKAAGASGMVGGQMRDIEAETASFASYGAIADMQSMKTGALFCFACEAGAIMAGAERSPLRQYAEHLGLAFQIADDILDVEATPEALGKATRKDRGKGKATFVDFLGLDGAKREADRLVESAEAAIGVFGPRAELLKAAARYSVARRK